jgi:hypothetical protein
MLEDEVNVTGKRTIWEWFFSVKEVKHFTQISSKMQINSILLFDCQIHFFPYFRPQVVVRIPAVVLFLFGFSEYFHLLC